MIGPLLALSVFGFLHRAPPAPHAPRATTARSYDVGGWRLQVRRDRFAESVSCRLHQGDAWVVGDRLIWGLGPGVESAHAVYRIDAGVPTTQSERVLPATANLANPSDGLVIVDVQALAGARVLEVRANPRAKVRRLRIDRLAEAIAAAGRQGCGPLKGPLA